MAEPIMVAEGTSGQVQLYDNLVRIARDGTLNKISFYGEGEKEIPLDQITGIQFREPSFAIGGIQLGPYGYIQFGQAGYEESDGGIGDAATDENSVTFKKSQLPQFLELRNQIEDRLSNGPGSGTPTAIELLRTKFASGELTEEEYRERLEVLEGD